MSYKKYKNNYGWCKFPFTDDSLSYCWGYALMVDKNVTKEEIYKMCSKKVTKKEEKAIYGALKAGDYWCEYFKPNNKKKGRKNKT